MLFNEPKLLKSALVCQHREHPHYRFSALQRAEIAEIRRVFGRWDQALKGFSALQRAEIAEIPFRRRFRRAGRAFQCSSTSRNC